MAGQNWKSVSIPVDINVLQQTGGDVCYKGPKITAGVNLGAARCGHSGIKQSGRTRVGLLDEL